MILCGRKKMTKDSDLTFLVGEEKEELTRNQIIEASLSGEENIGDFISGHNSARSAIKKRIEDRRATVKEIWEVVEKHARDTVSIAQHLHQKYILIRKEK